MGLFKFHESKAVSTITILFRLMELLFFLIMVSRFSVDQFDFSFKHLREYFRGISSTLISPWFVFVLGNAIILVLLLISGRFSPKNGGKNPNFYDHYVEKCQENAPICSKEEYEHYGVRPSERSKICRSYSENLETAARESDEHRRKLRRSMTESFRKVSAAVKDDMSSEEFRETVEAFIARRQRFLREEEELSSAPVVPI